MSQVTVGVLADPDLPVRLARHLVTDLPDELRARGGDEVDWRVETLDAPFEAMYPGDEYLIDKARHHVRDTSWDLALCLTDLPVRDDTGVRIATIDSVHRVALVSVPALGGLRLRHRVTALAATVVGMLAVPNRPPAGLSPFLAARSRRVRIYGPDCSEVNVYRPRLAGTVTLLAGMVRANRPWQLVVGLSTALAGALAGTAFGVLYSSIWQLATVLGPWRLAAITMVALVTLTVWIVLGHSLWQRPEHDTVRVRDPDRTLRNIGTLTTVAAGAITFFATLYLLTLGAVALTVPPAYLGRVLARHVDVRDYLTIALMATVLGTIAGAVGSGLEDDVTVRKAAYGGRERERLHRAEQLRRASES